MEKSLIAFLVLIVSAPLFAQQSLPEPPPKIPFEHLYEHPETKVVFPNEIANLKADSYTRFKHSGNGIGIRYQGAQGTRADVYVSNRGMKEIKDDPTHKHITKEIGDAAAAIRQVEKMGHYSDVEIPNQADIKRRGGLTLIKLPVTYRAKPQAREIKTDLWQSTIAATVYSDHLFKIRYSFNGDADEKKIEARDEFIDAVLTLIIESEMLPQVHQWLETYEKDPLSDEGKDVAAGILGYVEASELISMTIDTKALPWFEEDDYPGSSELLAAYIAGNLKAQLKNRNFLDSPYAGVRQSLKVYQMLIGANSNYPKVKGMDRFLKLEKSGKLQKEIDAIVKK